jgi:endonuclease/exonuclease/phosphatase family metal-dependent hydrolase
MFLRRFSLVGAAALLLCILNCMSAQAQLRIVDYNTTAGPRAGMDAVLAAIGSEVVGGIAKAPDVLALQEQTSFTGSTLGIVNLLNSTYGAGTYAQAALDGGTSGAGRPGLIYNTQTVQLIDAAAFGVVGTSAQARQTLRYQLRPVGYDSTADFYIYSDHYKAGTASSDRTRRDVEATALRANLDGLGQGVHAILAGDFNIRSSSEASYQTLLAAGNGQAFDPLGLPGSWHDNASFKSIHTQAPAANPADGGLIGGGMDDRFDFQLMTGEFLDGEGLSYIPGSYHALGNNGSHQCCSFDISTGSGAPPQVMSALMTASDHLPVIADYQLPAVMEVLASSVPATLTLGESFDLEIMVRNAANVVAAIGADELDYTVASSGDLVGSFIGMDQPLGGGNMHLLSLDTSSVGFKTGTITVESSSQAVANGFVQIPVSYTVVAVPEPASGLLLFGSVIGFALNSRRRRGAAKR